MSDTDLIADSFAGKTKPGDLQLTDGEKALLIKLLSNTAFFPEQFKSWLGAMIPFIMKELPISQVSGFLPLKQLEGFSNSEVKFLRGDAAWVQPATDPRISWDESTVDWDDATYSWDGR